MSKTKEAPALKSKKATVKLKPTQDQIAARAYKIYLERGATPGDPMQDWLQAERDLVTPPKARSPAPNPK